ncbi:hypothetical protein D9M68_350920 [compost metagenome]
MCARQRLVPHGETSPIWWIPDTQDAGYSHLTAVYCRNSEFVITVAGYGRDAGGGGSTPTSTATAPST